MKVEIKKIHIENDVVNNEPKLILTDENGTEWVMSNKNTAYGFVPILVEKSKDWYFDEKNKG